MTDLKFTSPSGETTIKVGGTGRLGTVTPKTQLHIHKMTDKITLELTLDELKELDKNLYYCEETWGICDKIRNAYPQPKMTFQQEGDYVVVSYNDMTYYRLMGEDSCFCWYKRRGVSANHPTPTLVMITDAETERLLDGIYYNDVVVKKETAQERGERVHNEMEEVVRESVKWCEEHPDKDPLDWLKPQTPEQVADGLKEAFREAIKQGIIPEINEPTDELIDKLTKKPPEFLKFELGKTLTDLIYRWWDDVFTTHSDWDMETSIGDLVDQIQLWLPKEQSAAGSQSLGVEDMVQGFNDCLNKIKGKLR